MPRRTDTPSKPTICQVLHSLHIGGAEVLAAGLARALSDRFRFVFACLDDVGCLGEQLRDDGFTVELLGRKDGIDWRCGRRLGVFLKTQQVDVLHAHQYTPFFQSLVGRLSRWRTPIVITEHGRHFPDSRSAKRVAVNRLLMRRRDRVIGVGASVRRALIANEGISADRVEVIYNGVDLSPFEAVSNNVSLRREVRSELELADDEQTILQVARLNPLKDHLTAISAVRKLRDGGVSARLILVGEGEERPKIEAAVRDAGLQKHVTLLGARRDISRLLSAADAFLLSSISEGIPLTLIEAMAAGVPVVSTDVGGIPEVIQHGTTGLLAPARDDGRLAKHLQRALTDSAFRSAVISAAQNKARERFSLDEMHRLYAGVYSECLSPRGLFASRSKPRAAILNQSATPVPAG
ncbi:glycosyltransferase [bacterium]|nr:glycosyltransferase [bacterium]